MQYDNTESAGKFLTKHISVVHEMKEKLYCINDEIIKLLLVVNVMITNILILEGMIEIPKLSVHGGGNC